jgi:hypothetical protein
VACRSIRLPRAELVVGRLVAGRAPSRWSSLPAQERVARRVGWFRGVSNVTNVSAEELGPLVSACAPTWASPEDLRAVEEAASDALEVQREALEHVRESWEACRHVPLLATQLALEGGAVGDELAVALADEVRRRCLLRRDVATATTLRVMGLALDGRWRDAMGLLVDSGEGLALQASDGAMLAEAAMRGVHLRGDTEGVDAVRVWLSSVPQAGPEVCAAAACVFQLRGGDRGVVDALTSASVVRMGEWQMGAYLSDSSREYHALEASASLLRGLLGAANGASLEDVTSRLETALESKGLDQASTRLLAAEAVLWVVATPPPHRDVGLVDCRPQALDLTHIVPATIKGQDPRVKVYPDPQPLLSLLQQIFPSSLTDLHTKGDQDGLVAAALAQYAQRWMDHPHPGSHPALGPGTLAVLARHLRSSRADALAAELPRAPWSTLKKLLPKEAGAFAGGVERQWKRLGPGALPPRALVLASRAARDARSAEGCLAIVETGRIAMRSFLQRERSSNKTQRGAQDDEVGDTLESGSEVQKPMSGHFSARASVPAYEAPPASPALEDVKAAVASACVDLANLLSPAEALASLRATLSIASLNGPEFVPVHDALLQRAWSQRDLGTMKELLGFLLRTNRRLSSSAVEPLVATAREARIVSSLTASEAVGRSSLLFSGYQPWHVPKSAAERARFMQALSLLPMAREADFAKVLEGLPQGVVQRVLTSASHAVQSPLVSAQASSPVASHALAVPSMDPVTLFTEAGKTPALSKSVASTLASSLGLTSPDEVASPQYKEAFSPSTGDALLDQAASALARGRERFVENRLRQVSTRDTLVAVTDLPSAPLPEVDASVANKAVVVPPPLPKTLPSSVRAATTWVHGLSPNEWALAAGMATRLMDEPQVEGWTGMIHEELLALWADAKTRVSLSQEAKPQSFLAELSDDDEDNLAREAFAWLGELPIPPPLSVLLSEKDAKSLSTALKRKLAAAAQASDVRATFKALDRIQEAGFDVEAEHIEHLIGVCCRCDQPRRARATAQWSEESLGLPLTWRAHAALARADALSGRMEQAVRHVEGMLQRLSPDVVRAGERSAALLWGAFQDGQVDQRWTTGLQHIHKPAIQALVSSSSGDRPSESSQELTRTGLSWVELSGLHEAEETAAAVLELLGAAGQQQRVLDLLDRCSAAGVLRRVVSHAPDGLLDVTPLRDEGAGMVLFSALRRLKKRSLEGKPVPRELHIQCSAGMLHHVQAVLRGLNPPLSSRLRFPPTMHGAGGVAVPCLTRVDVSQEALVEWLTAPDDRHLALEQETMDKKDGRSWATESAPSTAAEEGDPWEQFDDWGEQQDPEEAARQKAEYAAWHRQWAKRRAARRLRQEETELAVSKSTVPRQLRKQLQRPKRERA